MIAMQYKILLPDDYDMNSIRQRVVNNGRKTDGFQGLLFKAYLITERNKELGRANKYSPLYLWKDNDGMNQFIFNGFYDNILGSFGWQKINIGVPLLLDLKDNFKRSKFALEIEKEIMPIQHMEPMNFSVDTDMCSGKVLIYNPDKWKYEEYYFYETMPENLLAKPIYEILHLSV